MMNEVCQGCGKRPEELSEYVNNPESMDDPLAYVRENEGTYNPANGHFWCTACYIEAGMPLGVCP